LSLGETVSYLKGGKYKSYNVCTEEIIVVYSTDICEGAIGEYAARL
jgi:hypothetical protein